MHGYKLLILLIRLILAAILGAAVLAGIAYFFSLMDFFDPDFDFNAIPTRIEAGAEGVAVGGCVYRAGWSAPEVARRADELAAQMWASLSR